MSNVVNVRLVAGKLELDDHGTIHVSANPKPTTITWELSGVLTQGSFQPVTPPGVANPGFEWKVAPPPGYFGPPSLGGGGNSMSITDNHIDSGTDGQWPYILRVVYNGTIYCAESTLGTGASIDNPIIINR